VSVPDRIVGAWRRVGLVVGGTRRVDHCDVLWLQGREWYADIRLRIEPGSPAPTEGPAAVFAAERAFAGRAHWRDPEMTWEHSFDSAHGAGDPDVGRLSWAEGVMVEEGELGGGGSRIPYVEEWLRLSAAAAEVAPVDGGVRVGVARWGIEVVDGGPDGDFTATRFTVDAGRWTPTGTIRVPPGRS
jgi:hypothetical protein